MRAMSRFVVMVSLVALAGEVSGDGSGDRRDDARFNWPLPPHRLAQLLSHEDFEIRARQDAGAGVTGASKWTLWFAASQVEFDVKWKEVPPGDAEGWNNSPRKEVAAHAIQQWF